MHHVFVRYTKFVNMNDDGTEGSSYYGYRIFDDYEEDYSNSFESFESMRKAINEDTVREYVERVHPTFLDVLEDTEIVLN